jgi:hypothetical protein
MFSVRHDLNISPVKKKVLKMGYLAFYEINARNKAEPERPEK